MILHLVSILLRATERIHIPWVIMLPPEIIAGNAVMLIVLQAAIHATLEHYWRTHDAS